MLASFTALVLNIMLQTPLLKFLEYIKPITKMWVLVLVNYFAFMRVWMCVRLQAMKNYSREMKPE